MCHAARRWFFLGWRRKVYCLCVLTVRAPRGCMRETEELPLSFTYVFASLSLSLTLVYLGKVFPSRRFKVKDVMRSWSLFHLGVEGMHIHTYISIVCIVSFRFGTSVSVMTDRRSLKPARPRVLTSLAVAAVKLRWKRTSPNTHAPSSIYIL